MFGMEILLALGFGIGLSSVAGVRAFLPLALAALFAALGPFAVSVPHTDSGGWWIVVGVLVVLAVLEIVLDKIPALERTFNYAMVPVRMVAGAVLFAAVIATEDPFGRVSAQETLQTWTVPEVVSPLVPWLVVGAAIAGVVAVAKVLLRPPAKTASAGVSVAFLSFFEDVVGLVGGALGFFVPYLPLLLVAFVLFFYYRVRRRRGRKFWGLRILGD
jgi:uncharacterized membrane protein